jgi:phage minor structural protein
MWYILDKNKNVIGNINSGTPKGLKLLRDSWKGQLNDGYTTLDFDVESTHENAKLLQNGAFIVYTDNPDGYELFRIVKPTTPSGEDITKNVVCETAATQDLSGTLVEDKTFEGQALSTVISYLLAPTPWELGECFYNDLVTIEYKDYPTVLEAIRTTIAQFGAEIQFKVIFDGLRVVKMVVNIYEKVGRGETGISFEYERDLQYLRKIEDGNKIVTAMVGIASQQDANGNPILLSNAQKQLPEGFEVINQKICDLNALEKYGNNGQHIEDKFIDQNATNPVELLDNTFNALLKVNHPIISFEAGVLFLEQIKGYEHKYVQIGDYVLIKDTSSQTHQYISARVLEKERSVIDKTKGGLVLGEYQIIEVLPVEAVERAKETLALKEKQWNQAIEDAKNAQENANQANNKITLEIQGLQQFNNGQGTINYRAAIFQKGQEIDADGTIYYYLWQMYDNTNAQIEGYERSGKELTLSATEFNKRVQLQCIVYELPEGVTY